MSSTELIAVTAIVGVVVLLILLSRNSDKVRLLKEEKDELDASNQFLKTDALLFSRKQEEDRVIIEDLMKLNEGLNTEKTELERKLSIHANSVQSRTSLEEAIAPSVPRQVKKKKPSTK